MREKMSWFVLVGALLVTIILFLATFPQVKKPVVIKTPPGSVIRSDESLSNVQPAAQPGKENRYQNMPAPLFIETLTVPCGCGGVHK